MDSFTLTSVNRIIVIMQARRNDFGSWGGGGEGGGGHWPISRH